MDSVPCGALTGAAGLASGECARVLIDIPEAYDQFDRHPASVRGQLVARRLWQ
jgi:hypothetical protein